MKRLFLVLAIALMVIGAVSAQGWGNRGGISQSVTVNGTLQLQNGLIAVADGNTVYFVPMLGRYVGFIDGLREGNQVTVEGYVSGNRLQPSKMTVNGKSYDLLANGPGGGPGFDRGRNSFGPQGNGFNGQRGNGFGPRGGRGSCCW